MKSRNADQVYKLLGSRIVEARKRRGISQEQLAANSHIDRTHMGFIEQGRRRPTIATLYKIADSLGISLEQLFKDL